MTIDSAGQTKRPGSSIVSESNQEEAIESRTKLKIKIKKKIKKRTETNNIVIIIPRRQEMVYDEKKYQGLFRTLPGQSLREMNGTEQSPLAHCIVLSKPMMLF